MKNTRGEPSAGGQTAPRETLPISCLFVLFRSLRVVRAANIVTMDKPAFVGFGMAFSHPHLRPEKDEVSSSARRYNIHSTAVGITKAIGKDYAESGHCCSMYCTYERGRIRLN